MALLSSYLFRPPNTRIRSFSHPSWGCVSLPVFFMY